jgi:hypothetical protein
MDSRQIGFGYSGTTAMPRQRKDFTYVEDGGRCCGSIGLGAGRSMDGPELV